MIDWAELTLFLYILARMCGCVLFNPILGRQNIPAVVKTGMALLMAVAVMGVTGQSVAVPFSTLELALRMALELGVGVLLGMAMNFFFYIPSLAGSVIDTQMGMTMNQIYDAGSQANLSVSGVLLNTLMTLLFFAANGHHTLLRIIMTSGEVVPFGHAALGEAVLRHMLTLFIECTLLAVKLCMPILAAELLGQIGMGILMKVIPQINVFAINIELKVIIGIGLLLMLLSPFSEFLLKAETQMLDSLRVILGLAAG